MTRNLKNINMIGKKILIENSSDITKIGVSGLVLFETKDKIIIKNNKKITIKKSEILKVKIYE